MARTTAALVLVTCALGTAGPARGDEAEDRAVRRVEELKGKVGRDTAVTDVGLKQLAAFQKLGALSLSGPGVTGAGLKELAALKTLTSLFLTNTKATDAGVKELQKVLPKCRIYRSPTK